MAADGRFVLRGSPWPLLLMWTIFAMRYAVAVTLVFHPPGPHEGAMAVGVAALYGALSGLFTARAWRAAAIGKLAGLGSSGMSRRR